MQTLSGVSHEHHGRLMHWVNELNVLADCLDGDCLDSTRLIDGLPELRRVHQALTELLVPHMEAVEVAVYPTLERLTADRGTTAPLLREHAEVRALVAAIGKFAAHPEAHADRAGALALRRTLLRLYVLLKTHLAEEELYLPILQGGLTPPQEAALARALDHVATQPL